MTASDLLLREPAVQALGWALVHFIWQGTLVGVVAAVALRLLRNSAADVRYVVAAIALSLMATLPVVTGVQAWRAASAANAVAAAIPAADPVSVAPAPILSAPSIPEAAVSPIASAPRSAVRALSLERWIPLFVLVWMAGVGILALRLIGGWLWLQRIAFRGATPADVALQDLVRTLTRRLHISRTVRLLQSARADVPTVVGWLRPTILLPLSTLSGLAPAQIEAILAHELAHIRRHDYLVNLLQTLLETLLFYHPAVWWLSRRIRAERENCCDDLAVSLCGDPVVYASALADLEELRGANRHLVLAASGGSLISRVRRLLAAPATHAGRGPAWLAGTAAVLLMLIVVAGAVARPFAMQETGEGSNRTHASAGHPFAPSGGEWIASFVKARPWRQVTAEVHDLLGAMFGQPQPPRPPRPPRPERPAAEPMPAPPPPPAPPAWSADQMERPAVAPAPPVPPTPMPPVMDERPPIAPRPEMAPVPPRVPSAAAPPSPTPPVMPAPNAAPYPPPPPMAPPSAVPPALPVGHQKTGQESSGTMSWSSNGERIELKYRGGFEPNDTDTDIVKMSPNAYLKLTDDKWFRGRSMEFTADASGRITRRFFVGNSERPFEPEGREWLSATLPKFVRASGLWAEARVKRFYEKGGVSAVLAEITLISGDHGKRQYFTELLRIASLDGPSAQRVLQQAGREITSDYELATLLMAGIDRLLTDPRAQQAFVDAARTIESDYEMRRVYMAVVNRGGMSTSVVGLVLDAVRDIESDHEAASLLLDVAQRHPIAGSIRQPFFKAVATIESSHEKGRVLKAALRSPNLESEALLGILQATATIDSGHEAGQVLQSAARTHTITGAARDAYVKSAERLGDHDESQALAALVRNEKRQK